MGLFGKNKGGRGGDGPVDPELPDDAWWAASERWYDATVGSHYGTPDTMAAGGHGRYGNQDFGTALFFYAKAIDMLQTAYGFGQMERRRPSPSDVPIVEGFVSALGATLALHPTAPVGALAQQAINDLGSVAQACGPAGADPAPYRWAADEIRRVVR